jgi:hypothetical protein
LEKVKGIFDENIKKYFFTQPYVGIDSDGHYFYTLLDNKRKYGVSLWNEKKKLSTASF